MPLHGVVECGAQEAVQHHSPEHHRGAAVTVGVLHQLDEHRAKEAAQTEPGGKAGVGQSSTLLEVLGYNEKADVAQTATHTCRTPDYYTDVD